MYIWVLIFSRCSELLLTKHANHIDDNHGYEKMPREWKVICTFLVPIPKIWHYSVGTDLTHLLL